MRKISRLFTIIALISIASILVGCVITEPSNGTMDTTAVVPVPSSTPTVSTNTGPYQADWSINGTIVLADGTVVESIRLTVQGTIQAQVDNYALLFLDIILPSDFRYFFKMPSNGGYISVKRQYDSLGYYVCSTYCYDKAKNEPIATSFAVDPEKEYMIMHWDDGSGRYLVASANPDVTATEILTHFEDFVKLYSWKAQ